MPKINDAQALAFVQGQAFRINQTVYEARFPDLDFGRLVFVDTTGPEWAPGVVTYSSSISGKPDWQSGYAKDVPMADVSQDAEYSAFHLAAIGYQYNIEEINTAIQIGGSLPDRRARAARLSYQKFMYDLTLSGAPIKGIGGLINYTGVTPVAAASNGDNAPATAWVLNTGIGNKTPDEILADINAALMVVNSQTNGIEYADTILLPPLAFQYIAGTIANPGTGETILALLQRTNIYTIQSGLPLTVRAVPDLAAAATVGAGIGGGRMVAYKNDQNYVKLNLPMPHRFLEVYRDGPLNWAVPGIFRTGGLEVLTLDTFRYVDGITPVPA